MTFSMTRALVRSAILLCVVFVSYEQPLNANSEPTQGNKERYANTGSEGTVTGKTLFDGEPPIRTKIDETQDANCAAIARNQRTENVIVTSGKLANVFVYVKGGSLDRYSFEAPQTPVVLDQRLCRFVPHMLGIQTGQTLLIFNSDPTTHNVHPAPRVNEEWNQTQAQRAPPLEKKFSRPEVLFAVKCNQHPWMKAYVGVLAHPFFAVSAKDGSFKIAGLPAGDYALVAWHETLGEQTTNISIGPNESKSVDFVFNPKSKASSRSLLRTEDALVIR